MKKILYILLITIFFVNVKAKEEDGIIEDEIYYSKSSSILNIFSSYHYFGMQQEDYFIIEQYVHDPKGRFLIEKDTLVSTNDIFIGAKFKIKKEDKKLILYNIKNKKQEKETELTHAPNKKDLLAHYRNSWFFHKQWSSLYDRYPSGIPIINKFHNENNVDNKIKKLPHNKFVEEYLKIKDSIVTKIEALKDNPD